MFLLFSFSIIVPGIAPFVKVAIGSSLANVCQPMSLEQTLRCKRTLEQLKVLLLKRECFCSDSKLDGSCSVASCDVLQDADMSSIHFSVLLSAWLP